MAEKELSFIDNKEYQEWFHHLCEEIDKQRLKAVMQLNAATLQHYWWMGNDICASAACTITGDANFASTTCKFHGVG